MCWLVCTTNDSNPLIDSLHHVCESVFTPLSLHHIYSMYCFLIVTILSIICSHVFLETQLEMQKQLAHSLIFFKLNYFFWYILTANQNNRQHLGARKIKRKKNTLILFGTFFKYKIEKYMYIQGNKHFFDICHPFGEHYYQHCLYFHWGTVHQQAESRRYRGGAGGAGQKSQKAAGRAAASGGLCPVS